MKSKKILSKIFIVIGILLLLILFTNKSRASIGAAIATTGIVALLVEAAQVLCVGLGLAGQAILTAVTALSGGKVVSVKSVLFNESSITTASFFDGIGIKNNPGSGIFGDVYNNVANFYILLRNLSVAALLIILLYIGIRMAISTVGSDEAKYKKMLIHWAESMALVFVLHYIMVFVLDVNNVLVDILKPYAKDNTMDYIALAGEGVAPVVGIPYAILFSMLIGMELTFLIMYIKRIISIAFLIVIAPLITITYSIDKIGDGKSQALNAWLKEFIFTVIKQPFHCIIYLMIVQNVLNSIGAENYLTLDVTEQVAFLGKGFLYIVMLKFVKDAEHIVEMIFGVKSESMGGHGTMGAAMLGVMTQFGNKKSGGSGSSGSSGKGKKMPDMKNEQGSGSNNSLGPRLTPEQTSQMEAQQRFKQQQEASKQKKEQDKLAEKQKKEIEKLQKAGRVDIRTPEDLARYKENKASYFRHSHPNLVKAGEFAGNLAGNAADWLGDKAQKQADAFKNAYNSMGGSKGIAEKAAKLAAGGAMMGFSLGAGADVDKAMVNAKWAEGAADSINDAIEEHKNNVMLEQNEDVFKQRYQSYMEQFKTTHAGLGQINGKAVQDFTKDDIVEYTTDLFKKYSDGVLGKSGMNDIDKALVDTYDDMKYSYSATGNSDADDMIERLSKQAAKKYRGTI